MAGSATEARRILGHIDGGRVLDVATGRGGFIGFLADGLARYDEILGVDLDGSRRDAFETATIGRPAVRFEETDFLRWTPETGMFDTVAISAALHHFDDPVAVLGLMHRVVRPGGWVVVAEMYRDDQTEPQLTEVMIHDWVAVVDAIVGTVHHPTFRRAEIVRLVDGLALRDLRLYDLADLDDDPHDPEAIAELDGIIDRGIAKAEGHPKLQAQGQALRARIREVGVQDATMLIEVGRVAAR